MKHSRVCHLLFALLLMSEYTHTTSDRNGYDTFIYNPYEHQTQSSHPFFQNSSAYQTLQLIRSTNKNKTQPDNTLSPRNSSQENLFFRPFAWVGEHIADGISYLIDDDKPRAKKAPSLEKKISSTNNSNSKDYEKVLSIISVAEDDPILIQKLASAVDKMPEIIDKNMKLIQHEVEQWHAYESDPRYVTRLQSWQESVQRRKFTFKKYELTSKGETLFRDLELDNKAFVCLYGNQFQHALHSEFVDLANRAGLLYFQTTNSEALKFSQEIATFSDVGSSHLKTGYILQAVYTADFCWALLDCGVAFAEGAFQAVKNIGNQLRHPIVTAANVGGSIFMAGYYLGTMLAILIDDGILSFIDPKELERRMARRVGPISETLDAIEDTLKSITPRDVVKESTTFIVEGWLTGKILSASAKFFKEAKTSIFEMAKKLIKGGKEAEAIIAEGFPVRARIAKESTNCLFSFKDSGKQTGRSISKSAKPHGGYKDAPYHSRVGNSLKSKKPMNGQQALDVSICLNNNTARRISINNGEFVVLDKTSKGLYHGHVRSWSELTHEMKRVFIKEGLVNHKGKIIR